MDINILTVIINNYQKPHCFFSGAELLIFTGGGNFQVSEYLFFGIFQIKTLNLETEIKNKTKKHSPSPHLP